MPELQNTSPEGGATPTQGTPATGTPASIGATPTVKPPSTLEEAMARIADLERHSANKEEQATRHGKDLTVAQKRLAEYEAKERQNQEATLSEIEKANKARTEAEAELQKYKQQAVNLHVKLAAKEKGFLNPDIVSAAIASQLEFDKETGLPTNLDDVLDKLLKSDPYLAQKPEPADQQQQTPRPQFTANNPGRSGIQTPGQPLTPGQWPTLSDVFKKP